MKKVIKKSKIVEVKKEKNQEKEAGEVEVEKKEVVAVTAGVVVETEKEGGQEVSTDTDLALRIDIVPDLEKGIVPDLKKGIVPDLKKGIVPDQKKEVEDLDLEVGGLETGPVHETEKRKVGMETHSKNLEEEVQKLR
jgi:hypothetical protein